MKKRAGWLLPAAFLSLFSLSDMSCSSVPEIQQVWWKHFENEVRDKKYDYNNLMVKGEDLDKIMKSVYIVKTKRPLTIDQYNDIGTGTAMKFKVVGKEENCLLTDAHLAMNLDPRGPKIERELYIEAEGKKLKLERVVIDEKKDIALLRIPVGYNVNLFPFKIGHSGELKQGTYINFWGILNDRIQIKEGIISLLDNALSFHLYFKQTNLGGERSDYKTLDAAVNPGNSGGPVIAYRDGRPELVAIIELHMPAESGYQNIGGAINIELFIERLKQDNIVYVQPVQH